MLNLLGNTAAEFDLVDCVSLKSSCLHIAVKSSCGSYLLACIYICFWFICFMFSVLSMCLKISAQEKKNHTGFVWSKVTFFPLMALLTH